MPKGSLRPFAVTHMAKTFSFFFFKIKNRQKKPQKKKKKNLQLSILSSFNRVDTNSQPTSTIQSCHLGRGSRGAITVMTQISRWIWTCINGWLTSPLQASQRENSGSIVWRVPSKGIFKQSIRLTSNYLSRGSRGEEHPRLLKRNQFQGEEKLPHHQPPSHPTRPTTLFTRSFPFLLISSD